MRPLTDKEIQTLKSQGCTSECWELIEINSDSVIPHISNVRFSGFVAIHDGVMLNNIPGGIGGCVIEEDVNIINVSSIEFEPQSSFGVGTMVSVLDETGSRQVPIYPGLSSQVATFLARQPNWINERGAQVKAFIDGRITSARIGSKAYIKNCGKIKNVSIDREIVVEGASRLENGSLLNNAAPGKCFTYVGHGVDAENFILEDAKLDSKTIIGNCYIGQGSVLSHGFSAHDSLIFANCSFENGEVHSILAGPYTVSMHKGTLLIGCQTSFMNAGSTTNQSNHMYKLGPIHWGILERGVKTSSSSYLMMGAKIGAFSMMMGQHKLHPDTSQFPFSYLFGDDRGTTTVVPGIMLRSCGLLRDETKWPARDRRLNRGIPLYDHIMFNVLNPYTVDIMLKTIDTIDELLMRPAADDSYMRYKGLKFTRSGLERAKSLYTIAIYKYLSMVLTDHQFPAKSDETPDEWLDLGGQIMPRSFLKKAEESFSLSEMQEIFDEAFQEYNLLQLKWIASRFDDSWRADPGKIETFSKRFDELIDEDREEYLKMLEREAEMLAL